MCNKGRMGREIVRGRWGKLCVFLMMVSPLVCVAAEKVHPLQAKLDAGENLSLRPGQVVTISESLKFRNAGQRIETVGAKTAAEYARIVHADGEQGTLIEANGIAGAILSKLILDGNRQGFRKPDGVLTMEPMLSFGGEGAVGQEIRNCIVISGRCAGGWGAIHAQEGGDHIVIRDNVIFGAGADIRGNGRSPFEKSFGWGDGISTASRNTLVENNLIYDVTDDGVMVQGGPGTIVKGNVMVSISREMLGGVVLIDPFKYYELDAAKKTYDYRGVVLEGNRVLGLGGRIHVGIPLGGPPWNGGFAGATLVGARVINNQVSGGAMGYGFVVDGVDDFEISGNTCDATQSGLGDGFMGTLPDAAKAFQFNPAGIGTSRLQAEFEPMKKSLVGVLRAARSPKYTRNSLGYRDPPYPDEEVNAVVKMAFVEMLGRDPQDAEFRYWTRWLQETRSNADTLRRNLMTHGQFLRRHGTIDPLDLHTWRNERWLKMILKTCSEVQEGGADWPNAREWNEKLLKSLYE